MDFLIPWDGLMMREWPYTALSRDVLGSTSLTSLRFPLVKSLGRRGCKIQYIPPLGSVRIHFSFKVSFCRIEITNIQQAITNMHNMVMNHRGKRRSKTIGTETQLKQVDLHLIFSIRSDLNIWTFEHHITDNGTFWGSGSIERRDGLLEATRLQRPSSHSCHISQALSLASREINYHHKVWCSPHELKGRFASGRWTMPVIWRIGNCLAFQNHWRRDYRRSVGLPEKPPL